MRTGHKVAAYGLALVAVFGGTWAAGAAVGTAPPPETPAAHDEPGGHGDTHGEEKASATVPPGLSVSDSGYTLVLGERSFRITGPDGKAVTRFAVEHEKRLHLIAVRRDGSGFQHVHPEMAADGTWTLPLQLTSAGSYRVFADFKPENGPELTLGTDVQVAGDYRPQRYDHDSRTFNVDGYEVTLNGKLTAGAASTVTIDVARDGRPVTDLQPYLGAKGHLVALRSADLAYLHVHPEDGDQVRFAVEVPTDGKYRLFLDFQHDGVVRTAEFTLTTGEEEGHDHGN
ncbi:hypothetical protein BBK82_43515 [Lentzea guizhouensis]|uniref:Heavy metal-binding domain-containing protein n=1 Tax=Lentzea guizhouensis TaxID=1586287 RepID=A0A1B2HVR1_9PSEU|nr:hypothetical protein [Lentzea guizhouensis]ANZ41793.1 hypothetical protein BBK82_43515 [Lentzea guizhouensis]